MAATATGTIWRGDLEEGWRGRAGREGVLEVVQLAPEMSFGRRRCQMATGGSLVMVVDGDQLGQPVEALESLTKVESAQIWAQLLDWLQLGPGQVVQLQ